MSETPPPDTLLQRPPIDEAGAGPRWIVVQFFLHAAGGVASLRVLMLAAAGLVLAEGGGGLMAPRAWSTAVGAEAVTLQPDSLWRQFEVGWYQQLGLPRSVVAGFDVSAPLTGPEAWGAAAGAWRLAVWALFGPAIAVVAAPHLALADRPTLTVALRSASARWSTLVAGPAVLLALAGAVLLAVWLAGYASRLELVAWPVAVLWPVVGLAAAASALCVVAAVAGAPLFWAAWAVDRADGFDAVSTGVAYLYQRPLRLAAYTLQALAVGAAMGVILAGVTRCVLGAAEAWFGGLGGAAGSDPARLAGGWAYLLASAPAVFHAAYFWFAAVGVYLLMRRDIDEKPCDEVYAEGDSPPPEPA